MEDFMRNFVVYPNSLFQPLSSNLKRFAKVFVVEEPIFFGRDKKYRDYNINKVKLAYMRACLRLYYDQLKKVHHDVVYIEYTEVKNYAFLRGATVNMYDPIDFDLEEKLRYCNIDVVFQETQLFPISSVEVVRYFAGKRGAKRVSQDHFFKWAKGRLGILEGVSSTDGENRKPLPRNHGFRWKLPNHATGKLKVYYDEAVHWVNNHPIFKNNIGSAENLCAYPISSQSAQRQFNDFLNTQATNFGSFQDAIDRDESVMFHSFVSAALNNGLLSSKWAIDTIMKRKHNLPMNSVEGWIRQLVGWRTFMFGIYKVFYTELKEANHFGLQRKLDWSVWTGDKNTGLEILDNEKKKALELGYAHHIVRLMVFLNMFVLLEVRSEDVVRWFSEVVASDASHWVMWTNIACMGYYDTRFMAKPYLSSSAYLKKMSNYPSDGGWSDEWTALFYNFLSKHKPQLVGGARVYLRNLAYFEKQNKETQAKTRALAQRCIDAFTRP
jgi:deoxyribodipyrimidine photolyase-related protein